MRGLFANELRHYQIVGAGGSHMNANREQAALHLTATSDSFWPDSDMITIDTKRSLGNYLLSPMSLQQRLYALRPTQIIAPLMEMICPEI